MKYKRLIIVLSSILAVVVFCTILSFTLFRTNHISFDFQNKTTIFASTDKQNEMLETVNINNNTPIFAQNKTQIKNNLEKRNPYLKVINIETKFPNKLIIHCAEREELFYIKNRDEYFVCDDELKILSISRNMITSQSSPINLLGVNVLNTGATVGDYVQLSEGQDVILSISNAFAHNNKTVADIKAICKSIDLKYENNLYTRKVEPTLILTTYDNFNVNIQNAKSLLILKINIALNQIPQNAMYYSTHQMFIDINPTATDQFDCILEPVTSN